MHAQLKEMKSMGLGDEVHISGEEKQGQESKEKQSQIHYSVKLSHKRAPANQNEPHHSDTKYIQTLN